VNGVAVNFVKKGELNVIETPLFVAIRTEARSGPTKSSIRRIQRHIHTIFRPALHNTIRNCSKRIDPPTLFTLNRVKQNTGNKK